MERSIFRAMCRRVLKQVDDCSAPAERQHGSLQSAATHGGHVSAAGGASPAHRRFSCTERRRKAGLIRDMHAGAVTRDAAGFSLANKPLSWNSILTCSYRPAGPISF